MCRRVHAMGELNPPPPEQTATPSTACVHAALMPTSPTLFQLALSLDQCESFVRQVASDIRTLAEAEGSELLEDVGPEPTCEPNLIKVCVTFRSFGDGARLQSYVEIQVALWRELLIVGMGNTCPPYLANNGYTLNVFVGGDGIPPHLAPSSLEATAILDCPAVYPDDFPKCQ
jgi:hypothetical protein